MGLNGQMDSLYKQVEQDYNTLKSVQLTILQLMTSLKCLISHQNRIHPPESNDPLRKAVLEINKCGRPKGSAIEKTHNDRKKYYKCLAAIAEEYATELISAKHDHQQIPSHWLDNLIKKMRFPLRLIVAFQ